METADSSDANGVTVQNAVNKHSLRHFKPGEEYGLVWNHRLLNRYLGISTVLMAYPGDNCIKVGNIIAMNPVWVRGEAARCALPPEHFISAEVLILGHEMGHVALDIHGPGDLRKIQREAVADVIGGAWVARNILGAKVVPEVVTDFVHDLQERRGGKDYPDKRQRRLLVAYGLGAVSAVILAELGSGLQPLSAAEEAKQLVEFAVGKLPDVAL